MSPRGFTLIEMVVVLAVLSLVLGVAVPAFGGGDGSAPPTPTEEVLRVVGEARRQAVRQGAALILVIDARSDRYWLLDAHGAPLEEDRFGFGSQLRWVSNEQRLRLEFTAAGGVSGEALMLSEADGSRRYIAWSEWDGRVDPGTAASFTPSERRVR